MRLVWKFLLILVIWTCFEFRILRHRAGQVSSFKLYLSSSHHPDEDHVEVLPFDGLA